MTQEKMSPLRQRMIEDMRIRGMGDKHQKSHIRAIKDFTTFLGRSPETATPEDLRGYQLHMTDNGVTPSTFNTRIVALRFFFGMTCGREEMKRYMQFRTEPRKLPVRALLCIRQPEQNVAQDPNVEAAPLTLREPCPCCGGAMRIIKIFRRGQKPMSRAPPREQAA